VSEVHQPPSEEQLATQRLSVLDAFLLAAKHRDRVLAAIADARDPDEARRSVAELLGIEEHTAAAQAVVELRLRSFSQSKVAEVQSERDALKRRLGRGL
jgi:DNA gyrase/topoisomerase IV subunit A